MSKLESIKYTINHKKAIYKLYKENNTFVSLYRVIFHDLDKIFLKLLFNDSDVQTIHNALSAHHYDMENNFAETYIDWASARLTKPDKPLDAIETARKYYPELLELAEAWYNVVKYK